MSNVDNRIVQMQFDNGQFESGVQTSIKSLDNLKNGLNLDGATKSLSGLEKVGRTFSLGGIADGVQAISDKFSALSLIGITALQNITNSAINAGKTLVKSLTVDPVKMGFNEYETKMGAIQTILTNTASKGTTLDDVNKTLNELNEYSDKTIYNFSEMAKNIGTFTAAGIGLETSATSIKGIANLAAGSGSNAQQAATAMYQLSQALAAGSVKLMDWNSVVNAGMGGELFQNALKTTAKQMGIVVNESVPFRESLQDGWITAEVLTKTLSKFAEDEALVKAATQVKSFTQLFDTMKESVQSGWAQSWENIIGNKDEASATLTAINNAFGSIVGSAANARNEMLSFWKVNGGRDALIEAITNSFKGLQAIIKPITDGFREIFPAMSGERLVKLSKGILDLTENFKIGETTVTNIKNTFKGLFAILDIGKQAFLAIADVVGPFLKKILPIGDGILGVTGSIGEYLVSIDEMIKKTDAFTGIFSKIGTFLKPIAEKIQLAFSVIKDAFQSFVNIDLTGVDAFSERVKIRLEPFSKIGEGVSKAFDKISDAFKKAAPIFSKLGTIIGDAFAKLRESVSNGLDAADFNSLLDLFNGGVFALILVGIKKFIDNLGSISKDGKGVFGGIKDILNGVKGSLQAYQTDLKAGALLKIASAIAILAAALLVLSVIDSDKLALALTAVTVMFADLVGSMIVLNKTLGAKGLLTLQSATAAMITLSTAILILAVAMTKIAKLDWNEIAKGLVAVGVLSATMVATAKVLSSNTGKLMKGALGMIAFAGALTILVGVVKELGELDPASLAKGLVGVGVLVTELALFTKLTETNKAGIGKGLGLIALAGAISILATAVQTFAVMDPVQLLQGIGAIALILSELTAFIKLTGDASKVISTAIGLTILASAMLILSQALGDMGKLPIEEIGKGLLAMAGVLGAITLALNLMPKDVALKAVGLVIVAAALVILADALKSMSEMSWDEIGRGLVVLAGALGIIAVAMMLMKTALPGAAALVLIAAALAILAPVLVTLGEMSWAEIGKGLLALAGIFVILGVAGLLLAPLTPVIIALAGSIALLGLGCILVGAGLLLFSAGLAALAVSGTAGAAALVVIVTALIGLIPFIIQKMAEGLIALAKVIIEGAPIIAEAITAVVVALIDALVVIIPAVVEGVMKLVTALLDTLIQYLPNIIDAGFQLIMGLLKGLSANIQDIVEVGIDIVLGFLAGVTSKLPAIVDAAFKLIISFINGLADAIRNNSAAIFDACENLVDAIIDGIKVVIPKLVSIGKNIIEGLIEGIKSMATSVFNAAITVVSDAVDGVKNFLGIHSPSTVFEEIGKNSDKGLAGGLKKFAGLVGTAATNVGRTAVDSLTSAVSNIADAISGDFDMAPVIRPVLDLSNVEAGGLRINSLFSQKQSLNVGSITSKIPVIGQTTSTNDAINTPQSQTAQGASVSFVQNNYSPAALSRLDIYRQTKNQISAMKGMVSTA